ncbi:hypothetical protein BLA3211_00181 [Burkholderia aenigmatica]|uniref:Uncharacterized protein n=1 Tax=Burkholderia aenigmatica TaxID=2015348 RepID=A0A6J5IQW6_9BURK|nr:hypothetical protein BLA3211_00181 [Burkholderia aenigmatica]
MVNTSAKVVLAGITLWRKPSDIVLTDAQSALFDGLSVPEVLQRAKLAAAFVGTARLRLISLLDQIGLHQWLGFRSSVDLFGKTGDLVQATSVIQFPVFNNGENFRRLRHPERDPMLRQQMRDHFCKVAIVVARTWFAAAGFERTCGLTLTRTNSPSFTRVRPHPLAAGLGWCKILVPRKLLHILNGIWPATTLKNPKLTCLPDAWHLSARIQIATTRQSGQRAARTDSCRPARRLTLRLHRPVVLAMTRL